MIVSFKLNFQPLFWKALKEIKLASMLIFFFLIIRIYQHCNYDYKWKKNESDQKEHAEWVGRARFSIKLFNSVIGIISIVF